MASFLGIIEEAVAHAPHVPAPIAALFGRGLRAQLERKSELELRSEFTKPDLFARMLAIHGALGALIEELSPRESDGDRDPSPAA